MTDLRIAIFTGNYNHVRDGVSQTLNRLVDFLMRQGIEVLVIGPTVNNPAIDHVGELEPVPSVPMPGRPEYRITLGLPQAVQQRVTEFNPTLIHIASPDLLGYRALRYAQEQSIPMVASYHTHFTSYLKYYKLDMLESLAWKYLVWFYSQCQHVYVPSPSMVDELHEKGIADGVRIWARGVETELFHPDKRRMEWRHDIGIADDEIVVSFVSRLVWEKDLHTYVDTIKELKQRGLNVKALVVGDGPAREELEQMLPEAHFTGFKTGDELATAYASGDIFLFPSDTETFGNVTLEAMSSGLPCVVANATGSKSLVETGVNGYLVTPGNTTEFANAVQKIAEDEDLRTQMGEVAREKALDYSWDSVNGKLLENYREVVGTPMPSLEF